MSLVRGLALAALPFCVLQPFPDRGLFLRCGPARLHQGQEVGFVHLVQEVDGPRPLVVPVDDEIEHIAALGLNGDEPFYHLILGSKKAGYLFQISCSVCRCVSGGYLVVNVRDKLTRCKANKLKFDLPIFLKSHVELLFHLPRYALLILTSISIFY